MYQSYFILKWHSTRFGQSFHPSSGFQDCTYNKRHMSNRYCCLLASGYASKQPAVSVWHMPFAVCTVLNSWWWTKRLSETCRVSFQNKINLIHWYIHWYLVGFAIEIRLLCSLKWKWGPVVFTAKEKFAIISYKGTVHTRTGSAGPGRVEVYLYSFHPSVLDGGGWSVPHPKCYMPGKGTWYSLYKRLFGPQGSSGWVQKILPHLGFNPWTVQPVANNCRKVK